MSKPPIFVVGRQHSGNTLLVSILDNHPAVLGLKNEGTFFEHQDRLRTLSRQLTVKRIAQIIEGGTEREDVPRQSLEEHLQRSLRRDGGTPVDLYRRGMRWFASKDEAVQWAQKATSYIFYVDSILGAIPDARLIFLARNPLDIAASLKRRGEWRRTLRMVWGWNRGTATAVQWTDTDPERVKVVRYEDLVRVPRETMQEICSFVDIEFEDDLLEIPHVNRSETPYNQESDTLGINASRVHYYSEVLTPEEETVVRTWSDDELLARCYSDLPTARECGAIPRILTASQALLGSARTLLMDHVGILASEPRHVFDRIHRRIG
jgi:hypothetical protein